MKDIFVKDGNLVLMPNSAQKAELTVEKIQQLVKKSTPDRIIVNLCGINMFAALKIASLTGAYGLINNLKNKYEIIVDDEVTMEQIRLLSLANITVKLEKISEKRVGKSERELVVII